MRKAFCSMALMFALALPGMSMAAVQEFGPDFSRFTVDVPDGWTAQTKEGGVQLSSKDGNTSVAIQVIKIGSKSPEEVAQALTKSLGEKATLTKVNDKTFKIHEAKDNLDMVLGAEGEKMAVITYAGSDTKTIDAIMGSMKDK